VASTFALLWLIITLQVHHIYTDEQLQQIGAKISTLDSANKKDKRQATLEDRGHC